ncbi:MAG: hypothetical protein HZA17_13890 [Nitrospirae bacterium]|nr:hypothetical protein [Nitrospirota bacterium]
MRRFILVLFVAGFFAFGGCSGSKAPELYETANFEELQHNREHAKKLYEEIIKKFPDSEYAQKAKDRLARIEEESKQTSNTPESKR